MGLSATAYLRAGGFAALSTGEDRDLVSRLAAQGRRIARTDRYPVRTAARLRGRAPDGLADLLAALHPRCGTGPFHPSVPRRPLGLDCLGETG